MPITEINLGRVRGLDGKKGDRGEKGLDGKDGLKGDTGAAGKDGKSAYQSAKDGGYTGTEEDFNKLLGNIGSGSGSAGLILIGRKWFSGNGTYTPTLGTKMIQVICVGGAINNGDKHNNQRSVAGQYTVSYFTEIPSTVPVIVGSGTPRAAFNVPAGASSFGTLVNTGTVYAYHANNGTRDITYSPPTGKYQSTGIMPARRYGLEPHYDSSSSKPTSYTGTFGADTSGYGHFLPWDFPLGAYGTAWNNGAIGYYTNMVAGNNGAVQVLEYGNIA